MIYANIMAGGIGSRMGNVNMPKQFLLLGSKPIVIQTLEKFILNSDFDKIIVSCHKKWLQHMQDLIEKYISDSRVIVIEGGNERNDTIMKTITYIETQYGCQCDDVLVCHDAVRPFVTSRIISDNIKLISDFDAVDTIVPAFDTIVHSKDGELIDDIPVRDYMYQGQTPQTFRIEAFKKSYNKLSDSQKDTLSDSIKVCLLNGQKVGFTTGERENMKITVPYDLRIARALIEENKDA